jgi:hypothetical protein
MSRTLTPAKYNVAWDAHRHARELAEKGRVFALFLRVHYRDVFPESTESPEKTEPLPAAGGAVKKRRRVKKQVATHLPENGTTPVELAVVQTQREGAAPSWLPRDILELIMELLGPVTVLEVLALRQRVLYATHAINVGAAVFDSKPVMAGFPSIGPADRGYLWCPWNGVHEQRKMRLQVEQQVIGDPNTTRCLLTWEVCIDLGSVIAGEENGDVVIPATAISVKTNAKDVQAQAKLTNARVEEMLRFGLTGNIKGCGKRVIFESIGPGPDGSLRFEARLDFCWKAGMELDSHAGLEVGDRVRINQPYSAYKDFATGREGVIRMIRYHSFVLYFVELDDDSAEMKGRIARAHKKWRGLFPDQVEHHIPCQRFHISECEV